MALLFNLLAYFMVAAGIILGVLEHLTCGRKSHNNFNLFVTFCLAQQKQVNMGLKTIFGSATPSVIMFCSIYDIELCASSDTIENWGCSLNMSLSLSFFGQPMSPRHSDNISQGSQVSQSSLL